MKFLSKSKESQIFSNNLRYLRGNAANNKKLLSLLCNEQRNFCAYTEKYIDGLDSVEVEHFNARIKYNDDYFNYYAVLRKANLYKQDEKYIGESFFTNRFFQDILQLQSRISYIEGEYIYEETDIHDNEAKAFIDFLGLSNNVLFEQRRNHISMLKGIFEDAKYHDREKLNFFRHHPEMLKFITAIEIELKIDLSEFYS